ncbi:MAG TPA: twin-arginine translocase TatA/TatE family subunit [Solirubrobacteraceae bacterium]|nr:twin-arginine translocase TatA/TatE family subunit [Solirubrobacteraceae bacterium]
MGLDNPIHIAFLLVILLLVFGAKRLPEMGQSLGSGLRGFKESLIGGADSHHADEPGCSAISATTSCGSRSHRRATGRSRSGSASRSRPRSQSV